MKLAIVVPTRNRPYLAEKAIRSVTRANGDVTVVVSDNSLEPDDAVRLAAACGRMEGRLCYVRPPHNMSMPEHWNWALETTLRTAPGATHIAFLGDRWLFRPGLLGDIISIVDSDPGRILSYGWDTVDDFSRPIHVRLRPWSGALVELTSEKFLTLAAKADVWHMPLPRMLNSVTPVSVLGEMGSRFGAVFGSVAPDFCFAYRCLTVVDEIAYYDRSCLIDHSLDRSTGTNYQRSGDSPDLSDFIEKAGADGASFKAPVPDFGTVWNVAMHEFSSVRELAPEKLPPIDRDAYLRRQALWINEINDPAERERNLEILKREGWSGGLAKRRKEPVRWRRRVLSALRDPRKLPRLLILMLHWVACGPWAKPFWLLLARIGIDPPDGQRFRFRTTDRALSYALRFPPKPSPSPKHLGSLLE